MRERDGVIRHVEGFLGSISAGFKVSDSLLVAEFEDAPELKVNSYVTFGLSNHVLSLPNGREVRQELVGAVGTEFGNGALASFLGTLAESLLISHRALLRGQLLGPGESIAGTIMRHGYVAVPTFLPDEFGQIEGTNPDTVFAWVIPVTDREAGYIREHGWDTFSDLMESIEFDVYDLSRSSIV